MENEECRKSGVWKIRSVKMRSVENEEWKMRVENEEWKIRSVENQECGK